MVFSSQIFLFYFLPLALLLYYVTPRPAKHLLLVLLSFIFYGWANPLFVLLMLVSTVADYVCGLIISGQKPGLGHELSIPLEHGGHRNAVQKSALAAAIGFNLILLGFFKYFNFGVESYNTIMAALGLAGAEWDTFFRVTLPLGISFYTFHAISYAFDVYRGDAPAIRNYVDYACYVSMFPQLVAGPIIRFRDVADQLAHRSHTSTKFARGVAFFSFGLAKKVLLANPCGEIADTVFGAATTRTVDAWIGAIAYAFQIYFDFSGYSDMAIGLGLMLGFVFAKNFDSPYRAESITDFWRRWHISLSTWLRDYLYLPLGGNQKGPFRTYVNLMTVMVLGGMWHGASWTFVIWGLIHGTVLVVERFLGKRTVYDRLPKPLRVATTFMIVCIAWVFFRADSLSHAIRYCESMLGLTQSAPAAELVSGLICRRYNLTALAIAAMITWTCPQTWQFTRQLTLPRAILSLLLLWLSVVVLITQSFNPFIYFMF